jgi:hypothetical protein
VHQYATGSSRVPLAGLEIDGEEGFRLSAISRAGDPDAQLPEAHTCSKEFCLPNYTSKAALARQVRKAVGREAIERRSQSKRA